MFLIQQQQKKEPYQVTDACRVKSFFFTIPNLNEFLNFLLMFKIRILKIESVKSYVFSTKVVLSSSIALQRFFKMQFSKTSFYFEDFFLE